AVIPRTTNLTLESLMKMEFQRKRAAALGALAALVAVVLTAAACAGRAATVESEPVPLTEEDYYGAYDLYLGGVEIREGEPAPMTAEWTETEFVASQGGQPTIRTAIAIDPENGEIRIWDDATGDVQCASEGVYAYEDDGTMITMELISDPCPGRADSADGARLVRRDSD
ncbi:MAG: hypothetical protein ACODAB_01225, partial [Gemmatimonadota bacterium]